MVVLICDDDPSSRFVLKRMLTQHLGCSALECGDGVEALSLLEQHAVDLVILDLQMPVMDGLEILEAVRATPSLKHLPVIAVSNERREEVVRRLLALHVDGYVLKPIRTERLLTVLDRMRPRLVTRGQASRTGTTHQVRLGPDTVAMLVDGNLDYRHFFLSQAQRFGPIVEATSGAAALGAWKTAPASLVFLGADLGILDAARLVPKLRALAAGSPLRLIRLVEHGVDDPHTDGCDDIMRRSFLAEPFQRELRAFRHTPGPLAAVTRLVGEPGALVTSAARQVFGMMMDAELLEGTLPAAAATHVGALGTIVVAHDYVVTFKLFATPASLTLVTGRMLGLATDDVTPEDLVSTAGELVNLITGRLHAVMDERGVVSDCSLPTLVSEPKAWIEPDIEDRGVLQHFQVADTEATLHMTFEVAGVAA